MPPLNRDPEYLQSLQDYYAKHKTLPNQAGLVPLLGFSSRSAAQKLVGRMILAGYLKKTPDNRLAPGARFFERVIVDTVRAGMPEESNQLEPEVVTIDDYLVHHPANSVLFKVRGDSMVDAGILEGDFVIIERCVAAAPGQIVLAIVDQEFTLKYLDVDANGFFLRAGNPAYPPIRPTESLEIYGIYVGMFRRAESISWRPGVGRFGSRPAAAPRSLSSVGSPGLPSGKSNTRPFKRAAS